LIFVTVGGQLPFDRLVRHVDDWAAKHPDVPVFAQIGHSDFVPPHLSHARLLPGAEFQRRMQEADAIVGHAGMGTILTALELRKPLLIFPRRAAQGEHRNDHQLATARYFAESGLVRAAFDETELGRALDELGHWEAGTGISPVASQELLARIRSFVFGEPAEEAS